MAITNLTGTKWLLPENLNSTGSIYGNFDIDISPYKIELNTLLKLNYPFYVEEMDSITTWEELLDIVPYYLITDIGGTNIVNNLVVENDKNNYLIVPTRGYLIIHSYEEGGYLYYGLDLALAYNMPIVSGTLTFDHPIDGTLSFNFIELFNFFFSTSSSTNFWSEMPIPPGGTMLDPLLSTMTITGGDDVTNPTLIAWLEANATQIYTITFDSNGGSIVPQTSNATQLPDPLPTPTKSGYTFVAWYIDSALTTRAVAGATIEEDTTLYAKWHNLGSLFTEIANAIRSKDGTSENIRDVDFGERVKQIQGAIELTQAQYDALETKDANTYYLIVEVE